LEEPKEARPPKKARILDYLIGLVSYLLILLPAALGALYVHAFGVSVVYSDAWSVVSLFDKWSSGTLQVSDLFHQHNEHRMFFPEGVELLLGSLTKYDNIPEMYLIQICLLITLVILLFAFKDNIKSAWLFLFVPVSFLIFGFRQYENMLFGYQINFAFAEAFGVLTLFLLYVVGRRDFKKSAFAAALVSATIASYSVLQGLFVWPAGLLQLLIGPLEKSKKGVFAALWGLVGVGEWIAYFADYINPRNKPSTLYALENPVAGIEFFLRLLGGSLFGAPTPTLGVGFLVACFALVGLFLIYKNKESSEYSFWVSLLFYSSLILAAITLGRSGFGPDQALISRYAAFSILAVVGVYAMLVKMAFERRTSIRRPSIPAVLLVALSGAMLLGVATSYPDGIDIGSNEKLSREKAAFVLSTYESQPDEALTESLNPHAKVVREDAPVLQRLGYNVFSEEPQARGLPPPLSDLSPVGSSTSSGIDRLSTDAKSGVKIGQDRSIAIPKEASFVKVTGWAVDADNGSTAGGVYIDLDGELFPAFYGSERQDVADSLGVPSYRYSGFERYIPIPEIGVGSHELSIVVVSSDREGYYRPDQKVALKIG
jgi:hypothetical protein